MVNLEHIEQVTFVNWFRQTYPDVVIFAVPNGGLRHAATARKLQLEGVLPGVPDLFVPEWRLWIEMKRTKGGKISPEQKSMILYLESCGYFVIVGYGWEDAKEKVKKFLTDKAIGLE